MFALYVAVVPRPGFFACDVVTGILEEWAKRYDIFLSKKLQSSTGYRINKPNGQYNNSDIKPSSVDTLISNTATF